MTKQEDKRLTSMLLCLTSQGFNCQGLHWEPAGCKGMQISSKGGKGMQISSKKRKLFFVVGFFESFVREANNCYVFLQEMQSCVHFPSKK